MSEMIVVLSYGMGVDSTAILLRWLEMTAAERGFELAELVVITAQTGDEFPEAPALVEAHVLPRLRAAGVRFVEVAKAGPTVADGIVVLQDSRCPERLHPEGAYRLSDELRAAGTVPQVAKGKRLCSIKFKGEVLDAWMAANVTGAYRHVIGFEAGETGRARRDSEYGGNGRTPEYPLIEWGWDRDTCLAYIESVTGAAWVKSCCTFCPFAKDNHVDRYASCFEVAVDTMRIDFTSLALNPRQGLFGGKSAIEVYEAKLPAAVEAFHASLADEDSWALVEVRRAWKNGSVKRSVETLQSGSAARCHAALRDEASGYGIRARVDENGIYRALVADKPKGGTGREHHLAVIPAGVTDKTNKGFQACWDSLAA